MDAGQVDVLVLAQVHPGRLAAIRRHYPQAHPGVRLAGEGIAVVLLGVGAGGIAALVHDAGDGDVGFVDLGEGDA